MRRPKFTIYHGFAASFALHSALVIPFALLGLASQPEEQPVLVIELQGIVAESQTEQKVEEQTKSKASQEDVSRSAAASSAAAAAANERPMDDAARAENQTATPPSAPATAPTSGSAGSDNMRGVEEWQVARRLEQDRETEVERLKEYVKLLTKKIQANLVYPEEGRRSGMQGTATVSFAILRTGQIRPETVKIVASSGQQKLDASALKTVHASTPFAPPPREMTVAIAVAFGRKARK